MGIHKAAGYASHSANQFCAFCWGKSENINKMRIGKLWTAEEVFRTSKLWKDDKTINCKDEIIKSTGIQCSEFNQLAYRDPVQGKPLGIMHNWLEGVLQHHFWFRWGFQVFSKAEKANLKRRPSEGGGDGQRKWFMYKKGQGNAIKTNDDSEQDGEEEDAVDANDDPAADHGDYGDPELDEGLSGGLFKQVDMDLFCRRMFNIVVPTGVSKLPMNEGDSKHGSLRAAQWYSMFAFMIPLLILELYVDDVEKLNPGLNRGQILMNIVSPSGQKVG